MIDSLVLPTSTLAIMPLSRRLQLLERPKNRKKDVLWQLARHVHKRIVKGDSMPSTQYAIPTSHSTYLLIINWILDLLERLKE